MKFKYEKIIDRYGSKFGFEVLHKNAKEIDWDNISIHKLNELTLLQINEIRIINNNDFRYFINIERSQLLNHDFLFLIAKNISYLNQRGIHIHIEITERNEDINLPYSSYLVDIKNKYNLSFIADDVSYDDFRLKEINTGLYDCIKIDNLNSLTINEKSIISWMNKLKKHYSCVFLAEKIENKHQYETALRLPFDYFQGFLFNE